MGNNLAKFRGKHNLTQKQLGEKLGISKAGMCHLEKSTLSLKTAKKCAEVLEENVFDILGTDVLKIIPSTRKEKDILINMIENLYEQDN